MRRYAIYGTLAAAVLLGGSIAFTRSHADTPAPARVFEMRTYYVNEGKMPDLHKRFRDHTVRIFRNHGMTPIGFWEPQTKEDGRGDKMVYLLAFPSREAAKKAWKEFGEDPEWKKVYAESHKNGVLVKKVDSVFLDPLDYSEIK